MARLWGALGVVSMWATAACGSSSPPSSAAAPAPIEISLPAPAAPAAAAASAAVAPIARKEALPAQAETLHGVLRAELEIQLFDVLSSTPTASGITTSTLVIGGGGGAGMAGGLGGLGVGGTASGASTSTPSVTAKIAIDRDDTHASNTAAVVAGMSAGFRRCYVRGLASDPLMRGQVTVTATLSLNGEVMSAIATNSSVSASVSSCVVARISSAQFAPPTAKPSILQLTVRLEPAPKAP